MVLGQGRDVPAALERVVDQKIPDGPVQDLRPRSRQVGLPRLVQLEVEVGRPGLVLARPGEVHVRIGPDDLARNGEPAEVGLGVRNRAGDDRGIHVVFLRALAERVVARARRQVLPDVQVGRIVPVVVPRRVDDEVAVVALEVAGADGRSCPNDEERRSGERRHACT